MELGGGSWAEADEPKGGQKRKRRQQHGAGDTRHDRTEEPTLPELFPPVPGTEPKLCTCPYSSAPKHQHRGQTLPKIAPREGQPAAAQLARERDMTGVWTVLTSHADASVILSDCI